MTDILIGFVCVCMAYHAYQMDKAIKDICKRLKDVEDNNYTSHSSSFQELKTFTAGENISKGQMVYPMVTGRYDWPLNNKIFNALPPLTINGASGISWPIGNGSSGLAGRPETFRCFHHHPIVPAGTTDSNYCGMCKQWIANE